VLVLQQLLLIIKIQAVHFMLELIVQVVVQLAEQLVMQD